MRPVGKSRVEQLVNKRLANDDSGIDPELLEYIQSKIFKKHSQRDMKKIFYGSKYRV